MISLPPCCQVPFLDEDSLSFLKQPFCSSSINPTWINLLFFLLPSMYHSIRIRRRTFLNLCHSSMKIASDLISK